MEAIWFSFLSHFWCQTEGREKEREKTREMEKITNRKARKRMIQRSTIRVTKRKKQTNTCPISYTLINYSLKNNISSGRDRLSIVCSFCFNHFDIFFLCLLLDPTLSNGLRFEWIRSWIMRLFPNQASDMWNRLKCVSKHRRFHWKQRCSFFFKEFLGFGFECIFLLLTCVVVTHSLVCSLVSAFV